LLEQSSARQRVGLDDEQIARRPVDLVIIGSKPPFDVAIELGR
jgi:hypothetical protein